MKPERLEMVGFAPFRTATEVDFANLELFALTGPTGAGKSSVIDAITFALYGVVARYDDKRSVEPIISLGAAEARIRFVFAVGARIYDAVRVVRRTAKGGATTAEARLESDGVVLASGAAEVTRAVEGLLGLTIDHFTRSVVLPQGEFASFLHDTPSGQQELVKALLDMGVLDVIRRSATERAKTAGALADQARERIEELADATEEAERMAVERVSALVALTEAVADSEDKIAVVQAALGSATEELANLRNRRVLLEGVAVPPGVPELARSLADAMAAAEAAATRMEEAAAAEAEAQEKASGVPTEETLRRAAEILGQMDRLRSEIEELDVGRMEEETLRAAERVERASETFAECESRWETIRASHAGHALVTGLGVGDPCPACQRPLTETPAGGPPDVDKAKRQLAEAKVELEDARLAHRNADREFTEKRARLTSVAERLGELEAEAEELPSGDELSELRDQRAGVDKAIADARTALAKARGESRAATEKLERSRADEARARAEFHTRRDSLATIGRPPQATENLAESWAALVAWCEEHRQAMDGSIGDAAERLGELEDELSGLHKTLEEALSSAGVGGSGPASARVAAAKATALAAHERVVERRQKRGALEGDLKRFETAASVASQLSSHLRADRFQGWLMAEALATLVEGANTLLDELSRGAYSLAMADRTMEVVDHRNAEERRSVRSLSGGETFLVSLALALSLGEQLANLAGGSQLDAIFLDEGFGSLDAETLETVAVVVNDLAAKGRIVGLVTHVKELAEQVPVRFEVKPGPVGSTIEKVSA